MLDQSVLDDLLRDEPFAASHGAGGACAGALPLYFTLALLHQPSRCVVLGSGNGLVPKCFALAQRRLGLRGQVFLIDGDCEVATGWGGPSYYREPERLAAWPEIEVKRERTETYHAAFGFDTINVLHIDADHRYESVARDFQLWSPKVAHHGVIILHDTANPTPGCGVDRFVKDLRTGSNGPYDVLDLPGVGVGTAIVKRRAGA